MTTRKIPAARLPQDLRDVRKGHSLNSSNTFTLGNEKIDASTAAGVPTAVLYMEPVRFGACPAAGTCVKACLHTAGNPLYHAAKFAARRRRSDAFHFKPAAFKRLLVLELARFASKNPDAQILGVRLNGTTDHAWENEGISIDDTLHSYLLAKFSVYVPVGEYRSIIQVCRFIDSRIVNYDYSKRIDRDFAWCKMMKYHLTLSHGSKHDTLKCAVENGLNYAAPFTTKKKQNLPADFTVNGRRFPVLDGDLHDFRPWDDSTETHIIGLRYKRAKNASPADAAAFCIDAQPVSTSTRAVM